MIHGGLKPNNQRSTQFTDDLCIFFALYWSVGHSPARRFRKVGHMGVYSPIYYCDWPAYLNFTMLDNLLKIVFPSFPAIRCPFCTKPFPGGRIEDHLLSCLTSPPLPYNSKHPICLIVVFFHLLITLLLILSYLVQQLMC